MPPRVATLATCNLNQWAMDFQGNLQRIKESITRAKEAGAKYRVGPELEVPGYGCEDHFNELDTVEHSYECIAELLKGGYTDGIVCDVGAPILHRGVLYNCRVIMLNGRILLIRPKLHMANDGNYRETRYFAAWKHTGVLEHHTLPREVWEATAAANPSLGQQEGCPFGDGVVAFNDAFLACETCEELFTPRAPHIDLALSGVEIISNGSGSHHQLRKLDQRLDLIRNATAKAGGVYLYANQQGCDGGRLYFDGCACVAVNGQLVAQGSQFSLTDVEVITATVDLDAVSTYRAAVSSMREQASQTKAPALVRVDFDLCAPDSTGDLIVCPPIKPKIHVPEEEIGYGPAAWLWDYLRRSGATGYLLPLSGGADSSATATIVGCMCQMVIAAAASGNEAVRADALRLGQYGPGESLTDAHDLANRIFSTIYMGTQNSSAETHNRAAALAKQIGAHHLDVRIDSVVSALVALFSAVTNKTPRFRADGGTTAENLALQNIQARLRMVLAFLFAQLTPWVRGRSGFLLVLGSANVDECLRGYLTKYDCSSADINPIGGISKGDLRRFLKWGAEHLGYSVLADVEAAKPTAELEPLREGEEPQVDEVDMGMTYEELGLYGRLRKVARCGPVAMYRRCLQAWRQRYTPQQIATKVKDFFRYYAANRHKATVLTPSYHAENYSPEDHRYDHRQFLYNVRWPWQFARIDELAAAAAASKKEPAAEAEPEMGGAANPLIVGGPRTGV